MNAVVDASVLVAAVTDSGPAGLWAENLIARRRLSAPHLVRIESTNVLRRLAQAGTIDAPFADLALRDLLDVPIELFPFEPLAARVWALRANMTSYDASYVALAESLGVPLATLDRRLARAPGARCPMITYG